MVTLVIMLFYTILVGLAATNITEKNKIQMYVLLIASTGLLLLASIFYIEQQILTIMEMLK